MYEPPTQQTSTPPATTQEPPLPVLGQYHYLGEMTWETAPSIIRETYRLNILGSFLCICGAVCQILSLLAVENAYWNDGRMALALFLMVFYSVLSGASVWLIDAIKNRNPAAWKAQRILSIIGLLQVPVLTVVHIIILSKWSRPEVKAWFRIQE